MAIIFDEIRVGLRSLERFHEVGASAPPLPSPAKRHSRSTAPPSCEAAPRPRALLSYEVLLAEHRTHLLRSRTPGAPSSASYRVKHSAAFAAPLITALVTPPFSNFIRRLISLTNITLKPDAPPKSDPKVSTHPKMERIGRSSLLLLLFTKITIIAIALSFVLVPSSSIERQFQSFISGYGKDYRTAKEYAHRLGVFTRNLARAAENQLLDPTARHGVTPFSDLSKEEFESAFLGLAAKYKAEAALPGNAEQQTAPLLDLNGLPSSFDWRDKGAVTEVKTQ